MSQKEFLEELRTALSGKLSAQAVLENIEYYRNYIEGEVRSGKSEAQCWRCSEIRGFWQGRSQMRRMVRMIRL